MFSFWFISSFQALESLLEKVTVQSVELEQATADMDEPFQRENVAKLAANKEKMTAKWELAFLLKAMK